MIAWQLGPETAEKWIQDEVLSQVLWNNSSGSRKGKYGRSPSVWMI
jgi:hypothetical protein